MKTADHPWAAATSLSPDGTVLRVRVKTRSSREAVEEVVDDHLAVRVSTPPVEGKANKAIIKLLARKLGIPPSRLEIIKGGHSKNKLILIRGWKPAGGRSGAAKKP